jgi:ubiquitin carboxyl-terminal hydrolase 25/28
MIGDNPENEGRLQTAVRIVRQDQDNTYGSAEEPSTVHDLKDWPVGCRNIGNTCYLNSVLQFVFTIKPLRNMVMECEKHFQDLSPEALESKKVGRIVVSRARAEAAQQCE